MFRGQNKASPGLLEAGFTWPPTIAARSLYLPIFWVVRDFKSLAGLALEADPFEKIPTPDLNIWVIKLWFYDAQKVQKQRNSAIFQI